MKLVHYILDFLKYQSCFSDVPSEGIGWRMSVNETGIGKEKGWPASKRAGLALFQEPGRL
jgi:hypothetical protein